MLSGSFSELANLVSALKDAGTNCLPKATHAMAKAVTEKYRGGFVTHTGPWGDAWPATKAGVSAGFRTGAMMGAAPYVGSGTVRMRPPKYWSYFQAGAPARDGQERTPRGLLPFGPSTWDAPIERDVRGAIEKHFLSMGAKL
jgi:hypothetical protein